MSKVQPLKSRYVHSRAWRRMVARVVREEPICRIRLPGCTIRSTTADHIYPRKTHPHLEMERWNLRGACQPCNHRRGTGNPQRIAQIHARAARQRPAPALKFFEGKRNV